MIVILITETISFVYLMKKKNVILMLLRVNDEQEEFHLVFLKLLEIIRL
jgi:hypothetical protein